MSKTLEQVISRARRRMNLETRIGYLGKGTGEPRNHDRPGELWVREQLADGQLSAPVSMEVAPNVNLKVAEGYAVEIGLDTTGNEVILGAYVAGIRAAGGNTLGLNPLDQATNSFVDSTRLTTFYCDRHPDVTNKPFTVIVMPALLVVDDTITLFPDENSPVEIDLTSLVPSAGEYCWAVVFWKTDNTLEAFASTANTKGDPVIIVDALQECYDARSTNSLPIWAWYLDGDASALDQDKTKSIDMRQFINVISSSGGGGSGDVLIAIRRSWFGI